MTSVCVLSDGRVVSGSRDNSIKVWDLLLGSCVLTLTGHTHYVVSVSVLSDGRVVSGSADGLVVSLHPRYVSRLHNRLALRCKPDDDRFYPCLRCFE